ncbi:hypothetical protein BST33_16960 [Mycolicibacter minnesotensis]|uniref:GmrSD restriction endonucleases C-terminal domain-containing protein n=1 Tax=Mycolicibacter minnesotensis TaxID=1118379 RepID=A0AA91RKW1_9MYCO|nr:hypothetical protein BST33_16960 [Mycolicibacter minnesotensis]
MTRRQLALIILTVVAVCAVIALLVALVVRPGATSPQPPLTSSYPKSSLPPLERLDALPVKGRAPKTGYDRALFGIPWSDDVTVEGGHNYCDTRTDILRRDLGAVMPDSGCAVASGVLKDPYTGKTVIYHQVPEEFSPIQIDHVVPLLDAWQKGAQVWDDLTRRNFANDPINLQTTTAAANQQKGSSDAATWLPANDAYRCTYATRIVEVKARYRLWVTEDEREALEGILRQCGKPIAPSSVGTTTSRPTVTYRAPAPPTTTHPRCYRNVKGVCVPLPSDAPYPPRGANALCTDGSYSFSDHRRGSCARHGGVHAWLD